VRPTPRARKRLGRPLGSFTQHRRLSKLQTALEAHPGGVELTDLAAMLHVTTRSVRRYLDELEKITELESVPKEPGGAHLWRIKPTERGRSVHLRRTQAYALLAARTAFEPLRGSAIYDELDLAHRQILQLAQRPTRGVVKGELASDQRLEERFVYLPHPPRAIAKRGEEVDAIFLAVAELYALRFTYDAQARHLHPYAMVVHKGAIVVVGWEIGPGEVRCFAFERMGNVTAHEEERFPLPADFDVTPFLQGAFGVARPGPRTRVVVEFDAKVAHEVQRTKLHPSQKIAVAPDGRVRLSLSLPDVTEVTRWVLGFGEQACVIEPESLAAEVGAALRRAASRYA